MKNRKSREKKKNKVGRRFIGCLLCFQILFMSNKSYGQVPWEIHWDTTAIKQKQHYLQSIKKSTEGRPNIILIVADDLGKYDLSVYGNLMIQTPHIDQLARDGAIFTDGYATAPICSPSRAGMLTGRYQQRFGYQMQPQQRYPSSKFEWWWFKNMMNTSDIEPAPFQVYPAKTEIPQQGLPPSEITIAEMLQAAGYATAWIGKWHLGYHQPLLPENFGFETRYGCYEAFTLYGDPKNKNIVNARINEFTDKHIWKKGRTGASAIRKNETLVDEKEYLTYAFGREAQTFISTHKNLPFFLYMPVTAPHTPYQAPRDIYDSLSFIPDHNKRVYYSMVIALDKMVGDLMAHLQKENLLENTLLIFTSDNGAALYSRTVTNEPMAGGKFTFYEGGINVPLIVYQKNKILPATVVQQPVMLFDIYATIADAAGIALPAERTVDGKSWLPMLYRNEPEVLHENLYWYSSYNMAMRKGNWKMIVNSRSKTLELYELTGTKKEDKEISLDHITITETMKWELEDWVKQMPPMLWPGLVDYQLYVNGKKTEWGV
jgi:arylsulfatase A-like enzyme